MSLLHDYSARSDFPEPIFDRHGIRIYQRHEFRAFAERHHLSEEEAGRILARYRRLRKKRRAFQARSKGGG